MKREKIKETLQTAGRSVKFRGLYEKDAPKDPLKLFDKWFEKAVTKTRFLPNAMTLTTASKKGKPTNRIVLLKDYSDEGFTFFTNYESTKGRQLRENPRASLLFYWPIFGRQVIIEGKVRKVKREISKEYFRSRPRSSQLAASISKQSRVIKSRDELSKKMKEARLRYKGREVPCPKNWGGYCLKPVRIEFWQARPDRSNDRLSYKRLKNGRWRLERLSP